LVAAALVASPQPTAAQVNQSEVNKLVQTLDADPEALHSDFTPSVRRLIELGLPGALAVVDQLEASDSAVTRLHAQRVVEAVVMLRNGWRPHRGYPDRGAEQMTQQVLKANGSYRYDAQPVKRAAAAKKWRAWLKAAMERDEMEREKKGRRSSPIPAAVDR
jgi:hypothetical protein